MRKNLLAAAAFTVLGLAAPSAFASNCSTSDLSMSINFQNLPVASCASITPGSASQELNGIDSAFGVNAALLATDDAGGHSTSLTEQGIKFTLDVDNDTFQNGGTFTLAWQDVNGALPLNLPVTMNLQIGLYGDSKGAGYALNNVTLPIFLPNTTSGSFDISFQGGQGFFGGGNLDHMSVYGVISTDPTTPVREPASLVLLGTALVGLGVSSHRKRSHGQQMSAAA